MIEHHVEISTRDGVMNTFIVYPEEHVSGGQKPFPVVFFYMDAPGKREELHDMARRIAAVGYYVVLPNLYYRTVSEFTHVRDEPGMKRMFELMNSLSIEKVMSDTKSMLDYVDADASAASGSIGAIGYCMSGQYVLAAAAQYPDRFKCVASVYGTKLITDQPDSPHRNLSTIQCETYIAAAETDSYAPAELINAFEGHLKEAGVNHRVEWYPGAAHGFAFPLRAGIYHKPSAERHWERLFSLFKRNLD